MDDARCAFGAFERGLAAGRAFLAGAAFVAAELAGEAVFAADDGADPRRRLRDVPDAPDAGFRTAAFAGAALVEAAFATGLADAVLAGPALVDAVFAGVGFAAGLADAAFADAGLAGEALPVAAVPVSSSARCASRVTTVAEALVTRRCRRTSSARASFRARSAFAIDRSRRACSRLRTFDPELSAAAEAAFEERACFAMVPPVMSTAGSIVEP